MKVCPILLLYETSLPHARLAWYRAGARAITTLPELINSLAPGRFEKNLRLSIFQTNFSDWWLRDRAITRANVDPYLCHHRGSLGDHELSARNTFFNKLRPFDFLINGTCSTYSVLNKMATILQAAFSNAFSWMKTYELIWLQFVTVGLIGDMSALVLVSAWCHQKTARTWFNIDQDPWCHI